MRVENPAFLESQSENIILCLASVGYLYLGLIVAPLISLIGNLYFIYAVRKWKRLYGSKRNFDLAHSLFHIGHPEWLSDLLFTIFLLSVSLIPFIMFIQSFWIHLGDSLVTLIIWVIVTLIILRYLFRLFS